MKSQMWVVRAVPVASALVMAAAPVAFAQYRQIGRSGGDSELFEWSGRVDREVQIVMRNGRVWTNDIGRTEPGRERSRVMDNLPRRDGQVSVQVLNGRGDVDVIQQPSAQNNYTTIVRIQDPRSGSDNYRLAAYWQAYSNGDVYGRNRGRDRGRDDRDDIYRGRQNGNSQGNYPSNGGGGYYPGGVNGNNSMMHWSGNVDDDLEIRIQNGRLVYRVLSGKDPSSIRADQTNLNIPNGARGVSVVQNQGRGTVVVTQQPSSWNAYTTVIRIRDPQGGYGFYDFSLMWQ